MHAVIFYILIVFIVILVVFIVRQMRLRRTIAERQAMRIERAQQRERGEGDA